MPVDLAGVVASSYFFDGLMYSEEGGVQHWYRDILHPSPHFSVRLVN